MKGERSSPLCRMSLFRAYCKFSIGKKIPRLPRLALHFYEKDVHIHYFAIAVIKHWDQGALEKEGFICAYGSEGKGPLST